MATPGRKHGMRDSEIDYSSWDAFMTHDGDTVRFTLSRTEDVRRTQPDRTFSADAVLGISDACIRWIGSRMEKYWRRKGKPAVDMEIELTVRINGEPSQVFSLPANFSIIDGKVQFEGN